MKKLEKLVPVVVAGMVVTGLTTMEAVAADDLDAEVLMGSEPIVDENAENEDKNKINNATPVGEPETDEETGATTTEMVVNPGVEDVGAGNLTVTETPSEKEPTTEVETITKETTDEDGTTTTITTTETTAGTTTGTTSTTEVKTETTTTNPDGSTTTTTTTETTTTETTESTTEITGEITSTPTETPIEPSDEEQEEIKDAVGDALNQAKDEDGTIDWNGFEVDGYDKTEVKDEDGKLTITLTSTETKESDKPLTQEELSVILGGVDLTENEDGTYSYTDENGDTVTVKVDDRSTETTDTTTKWEVEVEEKTKPSETQTEDVQKNPVDDIKDSVNQEEGALSVKDILNNVDGKVTATDDDGRISKVVDGSKTYEFTYEKGTPVTIAGMTPDQIIDLLPEGYELVEGKIYDAAGHELTFEAGQTVYTPVTISVKVTDTQGGKDDKIDFGDGAQDANEENMGTVFGNAAEAEKKAVSDAVANALKGSGIDDYQVESQVDNQNHTWTVTVTATVSGVEKTFTYTVNANTSTSNEKYYNAELVNGSGDEVTVTGSAYVSGETVVWTENKSGETISLTEGKVNLKVGDSFEEAQVIEVTQNSDGTTTVVTKKDNVTKKTYTFKYNQTLTDSDKAALLATGQDSNFEGLTKTTWTVQVTTDTTTTTSKNETIITGNGLAKDQGGNYTYQDGNTTITFENGATTYTTGNTTYTIVEEQVQLVELEAEEIAVILGNAYTNVKVDANGVITATYNGETVTVNVAEEYTKLTVKKTTVSSSSSELASSSTTSADASEDEINEAKENALKELLDKIKEAVAAAQENEKVYITVNGQEIELSIDEETGELVGYRDGINENLKQAELVTWIEKGTAINFDAMDKNDLIEYLEDQKKDGEDSSYNHYHLELVVSGTLHVEAENKDEDCVVLGSGLTLTAAKNAQDIVNGGGTSKDVVLKDTITYDSNAGSYQYVRDTNKNSTDEPIKPGQDGQKYEFYKVTGTVAYGLYTGNETDTDGWIQSSGRKESASQVADKVVQQLINEGVLGAIKVAYTSGNQTKYKVFKNQAELEAYGYLGDASNVCKWQNNYSPALRGYDLQLNSLTLLENNKVTAAGANTYSYSAQLTTKATNVQNLVENGSSLVVNSITSGGKDTQEGTGGSEITGSYQITQKAPENGLKDGADWKYTGSDSFSYKIYQTWRETTDTANDAATGNQYAGQLSYTYQVPDGYKIVVDSEGNANITGTQTVEQKRDVKVELSNTTTSTSTNTVVSDPVVTPPEDETPETETPGTTTPGTPGTTVTPGTPGTAGTPVADVEISDEDVPLAETPDAEDDFVEIADEEVPLAENVDAVDDAEDEVVDIADEDVPLAESIDTEDDFVEIADEQVPLTDLPDEGGVPLADVPQTGDSFGMWMMAAAASALALVIPSLRRKKDQE